MKSIIIVVITLITYSCFSPSATHSNSSVSDNKEEKGMKLKASTGKVFGFYNVENLFDTKDDKYTIDEAFTPESEKQWTDERYKTKLENLSKVINAMDKDLPIFLGMAEIENKDVIKDLINTKNLKKGKYKIIHEDSPDKRGIDLGFIYRSEYFRYIKHEAIRIELDEDKDLHTRDILYIQGSLANDDMIHIFLNHWPSRREGQKESEYRRLGVARILRKHIDEILDENENAKIVVMGDFNDYPYNKSITQVLNAKPNKDISAGELYNLASELDKNDKGTYNYKGDWGMLDQIMISKGMLNKDKGCYISDKGCKILKKEWMLYTDPKYKDQKPNKTYGGPNYYGGYSDHLPIYIRLN